MRQDHCGGRQYFNYIEEMSNNEELGDMDEFVHWSDYDDALRRIKKLEEALSLVEREASSNRVWCGERWAYCGLPEHRQRKIMLICEEALVEPQDAAPC